MKVKIIYFFLSILYFVGVVLFFMWTKLILISVLLLVPCVLMLFNFSIFSKEISRRFRYGGYIFLPILLAIFIRTFFIDVYFVPSSSMEQTLYPKDYVVVNKFHYGAKIPKRMQDVPVIGNFFKRSVVIHQYDLYTSLKSFKLFKREDIVVFKSVEENDKFLIKRIIGLPSDTLQIKNTQLFVNSKRLLEKENYCYSYIDSSQKNLSLIHDYSNKEFNLLEEEQRKFTKKSIQIKPRKQSFLFPYPFAKNNNWTRDNYGKLIIPKKGMTMLLDKRNWEIYKSIIQNYEQKSIKIIGEESFYYTFEKNYYFMLGDNRHASQDSRYFGFIPESYIQGKMIGVFSKERLFN